MPPPRVTARQEETKRDYISALPNELIAKVAGYLDERGKRALASTNKVWSRPLHRLECLGSDTLDVPKCIQRVDYHTDTVKVALMCAVHYSAAISLPGHPTEIPYLHLSVHIDQVKECNAHPLVRCFVEAGFPLQWTLLYPPNKTLPEQLPAVAGVAPRRALVVGEAHELQIFLSRFARTGYINEFTGRPFPYYDTLVELMRYDEFQLWKNLKHRKHTNTETVRFDNEPFKIDGFELSNLRELPSMPKLQQIEDFAFYSSWRLDTLGDMPALGDIGKFAFAGCWKLKRLPYTFESLTNIGEHAFGRCESLQTLPFMPLLENIRAWAFRGCVALTALELMLELKVIENGAFYECVALTATYMPKVEFIYRHAFHGCVALRALSNMPELKEISSAAFFGCTNLQTLGEMDKLRDIGENAFAGCTNLQTLGEMNKLRNIGKNAFAGCTNLQTLGEMKSLQHIGKRAFAGCTGLKTIHICGALQIIDEGAFANCPLESVTFEPGSEINLKCHDETLKALFRRDESIKDYLTDSNPLKTRSSIYWR